jgi:uncharacterized membrane protein YidH (DUF202 family)
MAKKVKKKGDEDEEFKAFHFPHFDVPGFIHYELEQTYATLISLLFAVGMAALSWWLTSYGSGIGLSLDLSLVALLIGFVAMALLPFAIIRFRERAHEYRKGDWVTLLLIYLFLWLALWTLLLNV